MAPKHRPKQNAVVTLHTQDTPETKQENGTNKVDSQMAVLLYRAEILAHMQGPLTVIQGDTGCGKSSQVPQFVLDSVLNPKIIVTQPRRLAAISLATRVAQERGLEAGNESIGYRVGQSHHAAPDAALCFVTTGWLLQKLMFNPLFLSSLTHLILDEIHERSLDADLLSVIIKRLLGSLPPSSRPKLVLMSATLDTQLFAQYFWPVCGEGAPPKALEVGGRRFPVTILHERECISWMDSWKGNTHSRAPSCYHHESASPSREQINSFAVWLCFALAARHSRDSAGTCVLVFLTGIAEIEDMVESLEGHAHSTAERRLWEECMEVMILHSLIEAEDQARVFEPIPPAKTRVVLATNIAESSLTLPAVRYVVDLGTHKIAEYSPQLNANALLVRPISQASAAQRAGRAGRVCEGVVFRLYAREDLSSRPQFDQPELATASLCSVVLRLKVGSSNSGPLQDVCGVLQDCLQPPPHYSILEAYRGLLTAGALQSPQLEKKEEVESNPQDSWGNQYQSRRRGGARSKRVPVVVAQQEEISEDLLLSLPVTNLGVFYSTLPFDLELGKLLAYGIALGPHYVPAVVVLCCCLSQEDVFKRPHPLLAKSVRAHCDAVATSFRGRCKLGGDTFSDPFCALHAVRDYLLAAHPNRWLYQFGVSRSRIKTVCTSIGDLAARISRVLSEVYRPNLDALMAFARGRARRDQLAKCQELLDITASQKILRLLMALVFKNNLISARDRPTSGWEGREWEGANAPNPHHTLLFRPSQAVSLQQLLSTPQLASLSDSVLRVVTVVPPPCFNASRSPPPLEQGIEFKPESSDPVHSLVVSPACALRCFQRMFHRSNPLQIDGTIAIAKPEVCGRIEWTQLSTKRIVAISDRSLLEGMLIRDAYINEDIWAVASCIASGGGGLMAERLTLLPVESGSIVCSLFLLLLCDGDLTVADSYGADIIVEVTDSTLGPVKLRPPVPLAMHSRCVEIRKKFKLSVESEFGRHDDSLVKLIEDLFQPPTKQPESAIAGSAPMYDPTLPWTIPPVLISADTKENSAWD